MSVPTPSLLTRLLRTYRSLPLPFRRKRLLGVDLANNTYWETTLPGARPRRSVEFATKGRDWVDYAGAVPVQWHQWLRATRAEPPSVQELVADVRRREGVRELARRSEERWRKSVGAGEAEAGEKGRVRVLGAGGSPGYGRRAGGDGVPGAEEGAGAGVGGQAVGGAQVDGGKALHGSKEGEGKAEKVDPWRMAEEQRQREDAGKAGGWTPAAAPRRR
ncbi:hypothetical protein EDC01DRAFT_725270 [Geopyxis carbonaria]|nr:hypothetical protein EDC01DRAFT_725270 [Geopyxis carbonaria]